MRLRLTAVLLALAGAASAALPDDMEAVVRDLEARADSYVSGRVGQDAELDAKLDALKAQLSGVARVLPASDRRKALVAELAAETARSKTRWSRPGTRYGLIGRELRLHLAAVRALDGAATSSAVPAPATPSETGVRLRQGAAAALELGAGIAAAPEFATRDAVAAPAALPDAARLRSSSPAGRGPGAPTRPAAVPSPVAAAPAAPAPEPPLAAPMSGPRVTKLQEELNLVRRALGQRVIRADGHFGPITRNAVIDFQRAVGIIPARGASRVAGVVDEETAVELFKGAISIKGREGDLVQLNDSGPGVERLQDMLNRIAGHRIVSEDGGFGGGTQRAVRAFQHANRLPDHGHVDEKTLEALRAAAKDKPPVGILGGRLVAPGPVPDLHTSRRMPGDVSALVAQAEREFGIPEGLFRALVWAEGGALGNSALARGPAQITESGSWGCRELGYKWRQIRDEKRANIRCGAHIFKHRPGEQGLAPEASPLVAASLYNTMAKHWPRIVRDNKVPPFVETTSYVTRISRMYCQYTGVRLLLPNRDLYPNMLPLAKKVDRDMVVELALEGREPRPDCSPF